MKFSIITITYNRAHLIGATIQSVLDQTHADFEYIIIDDGSIDDTESVVKNFDDARIFYHKYQKNGWRSYLRNEGFRKSTGELISVLDSDDTWTADKLETIVSIFTENPEIHFVIHGISVVNQNSTINYPFQNYKSDFKSSVFEDLLENKILPYPIFTVRAQKFREMGFLNEELIDGQHDFYLRFAATNEIYYCAKIMTVMKKHSQNISSKSDVRHYEDYLWSLKNLKKQGFVSNQRFRALYKTNRAVIARHHLKKLNLYRAFKTILK